MMEGGRGPVRRFQDLQKIDPLLVRDRYPCWTWTGHDTPQHTAAVALPWPCRPALSVYIGGRVGVEGWAGWLVARARSEPAQQQKFRITD